MGKETILTVKNLHKKYFIKNSLFKKREIINAVDDLSFEVYENEIFGIIGESGSGKTTTGELIVRLSTPTSGLILHPFSDHNFRKNVQIVLQQSQEVFDPLMSVEKILMESVKKHQKLRRKEALPVIDELLISVGLSPSDRHKKINTFSGGQLQRICIARALSVKPKLLILDEPVSALDVSVQGQIINLLLKLQKEHHLTYIMISHDLNIIRLLCDRIAVMKDGKIVELNNKYAIFQSPEHPYTQQLISDFNI